MHDTKGWYVKLIFIFAITPATLLSYANLAAKNIDRGRCDKTALPLRLIPRLAGIFMVLRVNLDWVYQRYQGTRQWWDRFDDRRQQSPKGMRSPMLYNGCSKLANCKWRLCQPKETADASQSTCDLAMLLICLDNDNQTPNWWGSSSCFGWFHSLVYLITPYLLSQRCFLLPLPKVESMANSGESATVVPTIRIVGEYDTVSLVWSISKLNCI